MSKITTNVLNFVTSISLLLLVYSLFILRGIQPEGYTVDIYEQLPFRFYFALLICYLSACFLLIAYNRKMSAVIILLLVQITVLIIPYMLGYVSINRYEGLSYIGVEQSPLYNLSGFSNLSPTGPLLVSPLALISGLKLPELSCLLPIVFSILFITGMFMFNRIFMLREKLVSVAFLSSTIPYFGHFQTSSAPYYLTFCLIPLYIFVLRSALSDKNRAMAVCLLFMIPLIPLAHPFIFIYLACLSLFFILSSKGLNLEFFRTGTSRFAGKKVSIFIFLLFTLGVFFLCSIYAPHLFAFTSNLVLHAKMLVVAGLSAIPETGNGFIEFAHLLSIYYGKYCIPLILILINSVIVWVNRKRFCRHFVRRYPRFLLLYIATFFLELIFLLNPFILYPPDLFANLSFIIFAQIPLLGYSLYVAFLRKGYILGLGSALLVLCLLWTLGFFTCFSSPHTDGISEAISQNEVQGIQWLSGVKEATPDSSIYIDSNLSGFLDSNKNRMADLTETYQKSPNLSIKHFKYGLLGKAPENESYLVETTFSQALNNRAKGPDKISVPIRGISLKAQTNSSLYKIYDSLNIKIYERFS